MRYPSKPQAKPRPTAPGVGPFVVELVPTVPWVGFLVDQNGSKVLQFNVAPGQATGCSPSQVRKRTEWLLTAVNAAWNTEQSVAAIGRAFGGKP